MSAQKLKISFLIFWLKYWCIYVLTPKSFKKPQMFWIVVEIFPYIVLFIFTKRYHANKISIYVKFWETNAIVSVFKIIIDKFCSKNTLRNTYNYSIGISLENYWRRRDDNESRSRLGISRLLIGWKKEENDFRLKWLSDWERKTILSSHSHNFLWSRFEKMCCSSKILLYGLSFATNIRHVTVT